MIKSGLLALFVSFLIGGSVGYSGKSWQQSLAQDAGFARAEIDIRATLNRQNAAWNRGDIEAFMQDYIRSNDLRFASDDVVQRGWEATLQRYQTRYPDRAAMGMLSFTDLEIEPLSLIGALADALVFGRWKLERESDDLGGLFTLHMVKVQGLWVIVSDHTSVKP